MSIALTLAGCAILETRVFSRAVPEPSTSAAPAGATIELPDLTLTVKSGNGRFDWGFIGPFPFPLFPVPPRGYLGLVRRTPDDAAPTSPFRIMLITDAKTDGFAVDAGRVHVRLPDGRVAPPRRLIGPYPPTDSLRLLREQSRPLSGPIALERGRRCVVFEFDVPAPDPATSFVLVTGLQRAARPVDVPDVWFAKGRSYRYMLAVMADQFLLDRELQFGDFEVDPCPP